MKTFNDFFPLVSGSLIDLWLNRDLRKDNKSKDGKDSYVDSSNKLLLPTLIRVSKRVDSAKSFYFYIDRKVSEILKDKMSDSEWIVFCEKKYFALEPFGAS